MLLLGKNANVEREPHLPQVYLSPEARRQGTYVVGTTGTGKTTLLLNLIVQDMQRRGAWGYEGVCVLDPHGDFTADLLECIPAERWDDVLLFDATDAERPFGLNLLDCNRADPGERDRVVSTILDTLYKLFRYSWGPRMEDLLRHSLHSLLLYPEPTTFIDLMLMLVNYDHRQRLTTPARAVDPILRAYWEDQFPESVMTKEGRRRKPAEQIELVSSSLNKVGRFLVNPILRNIVGQPRSTIHFRQAMDEGRIVLVNLAKGGLGPDNAALLGSVIVNQLLIAALSRQELPEAERRPFHLYVDEYQTFATKTFPDLQSEARKYAIDTLVAHQYRDQLDLENQGSTLNVANLIVLRVSGRDAVELAAQYDLTPPEGDIRFEPYYQQLDEQRQIFAKFQLPGSGSDMYAPVEGFQRTYSDVQLETANLLAQLPNYQAICRVLDPNGGQELRQYRIELEHKPPRSAGDGVQNIRERSRALAWNRAAVEQYIKEHTVSPSSEDDSGSYTIRPEFEIE